jgi:hypothetical protein
MSRSRKFLKLCSQTFETGAIRGVPGKNRRQWIYFKSPLPEVQRKPSETVRL